MLKLPICPYCGSRYDYSWVKKHMNDKQLQCRGCKKKIKVSYIKRAFGLAAIFFVLLLAVSTAYIFFSKSETIWPDLIFIIVFIFVYLALIPLCVRYKKVDGQEPPPEKLKKNRHRHKKDKNTNKEISFNENPLEGTSFAQSSRPAGRQTATGKSHSRQTATGNTHTG